LRPPASDRALAVIIAVAVASPMLVSFNAPPSPTVLNGLLSLGLWGCVLMTHPPQMATRAVAAPAAAAACTAAAAALGAVYGALPAAIAIGVMAMLGAAVVVMVCASAPRPPGGRGAAINGFWWGLVIAGLLSAAMAVIQVFAPHWPDGTWIARIAIPGRAGANLRQPNHLSTLTLWAIIAAVALAAHHSKRAVPLLAATMILLLALLLTGSRTGILGIALLPLWALFDRRLPRFARGTLLASPLVFALLWLAMSIWSHATEQSFVAGAHLSFGGTGDISSSRFAIWSNALSLIRREPWTGVGYGEFNLAWTLSAFPDRPIAFFDHTHNLPLQLLAELGVPLGMLVMALLIFGMWQAGRRAWASRGDDPAPRAAFMILLTIGLHSMLEYPLWYAYFLLPTAFAWGFALSPGPEAGTSLAAAAAAGRHPVLGDRSLALAGAAMAIGAAAAGFDYWRVVVIYDPDDTSVALVDRIERGQLSPLYGHHADYAAATAFGEPKAPLPPLQELAFERAPHQLLDVRLMIAWSQALTAQGELDKARWLAARIREFRNPGADEYFAPCKDAAQAAQAFQCQPPTREVHWREFTRR
jgi:O-antigen ligase